MRIIFLNIILGIAQCAFSQNTTSDTSNNCITSMRWISKEWKLDSTGNNGYRKENCKSLLKCKLRETSKSKVLELLGKPNQILETYKTIQYLYYYYDIRTLPINFKGPLACGGISINFREGSDYVLSISEFDMDL